MQKIIISMLTFVMVFSIISTSVNSQTPLYAGNIKTNTDNGQIYTKISCFR